MGGLTSILGGLVMFAIAVWSYMTGGFSTATLVFLVGAGVLFLRGAQGRSLTQAGDVVAPMDFVANPADAIVDAVTERVTGLVPGRPAKKSEPEEQGPAFDADAALARYLENRPADLPPIVPPIAPPLAEPAPRRSFGRKGL